MRKTQNHFNQLLYDLLSLILIGITFVSCEAENEVISNSRKYNNEISFEQFKNETGLFNFKKTITITNNIDAITARTANGDYELSDFNISTDIIKKLDANNIKSYTFRIVPKDSVVSEFKSIFNLSLIKKDGIWKTTIIEFRPTDLNYDQIKQGLTEKVEGQAKIWYHGDLNNFASETPVAMRTVVMIEHCVGGGDCNPSTGYCDHCGDCVTYEYIGGSFGPPNNGNGPPPINSGGNAAGSGSYIGPGVPGPFEPIVYEPIDWYSIIGDTQTTAPTQNDNLFIANVRDVDDDIDDEIPNNPCEKIKSKTSSVEFMNKFNNINKQENFDLNHETGFIEKRHLGTNIYVDAIINGDTSLFIPLDATGYTHVHNNKIVRDADGFNFNATVMMLSPTDLSKLITTCKNNAVTPQDAYAIMISEQSILSLTILDGNIDLSMVTTKWTNFVKNYYSTSEGIKNDESLTNSQKNKKLQTMMLLEIEKLGLKDKVGLFEGDVQTLPNGTKKINWSRKTLDPNNNLIPNPC